jgi:hypothetical protein
VRLSFTISTTVFVLSPVSRPIIALVFLGQVEHGEESATGAQRRRQADRY